MKIVIVGAGAMGCLFAGMLARAGHDLAVLERNPERAKAIQRAGITIDQDGTELKILLTGVYCDVTQAGCPDLLLLLVKAYDTDQALQACLPAIGPATTVLTLQNGLGNIEIIERHVPRTQILGGTTAQGATLLGHGRVRHAGRGPTVIGALEPQEVARAHAVQEIFQGCGISTEVSDSINSVLWGKLLINAGINALTAIMNVKNGRIECDAYLCAVMGRAVLEGAAVANRLGISLPHGDPVSRAKEVCLATAANVSSMLQDIRSGRRTEIDSINGAIAERGRQLGIATPVNSLLACLVKSLEEAQGR